MVFEFKDSYKNEKDFQTDYIKMLKEDGYWVYKLPDIGFSLKPFDIVALKDGKFTAIELKYGNVSTYDRIYMMLRPNQVGGLLHVQEHGGSSIVAGRDKKENKLYEYIFKYQQYIGAL